MIPSPFCNFNFCRLLLLLFLPIFTTCEPNWNYDVYSYQSDLVVEGWIETDGYARVLLSQTLSTTVVMDSAGWRELPVYWAKVTVSDGDTTEVLTGRYDANYQPPYCYTGSLIKGQAGKTYTLEIEYSGRKAHAVTRIPEGELILKDISVTRANENSFYYQVNVSFEDDPNTKDYYKFFTRDKYFHHRFYSSKMGTIDDAVITGGSYSIPVYRHTDIGSSLKEDSFFHYGSQIGIKFTRIGLEEFLFWNSYENQIVNNKNPLFGKVCNLSSNVTGASGIWCGYQQKTVYLFIR